MFSRQKIQARFLLSVQILSWGYCGQLGIPRLFRAETALISVPWAVSTFPISILLEQDEGRGAGSSPCPSCCTHQGSLFTLNSQQSQRWNLCSPVDISPWEGLKEGLKEGEYAMHIHYPWDPLPFWLFLLIFKLISSCNKCNQKCFQID